MYYYIYICCKLPGYESQNSMRLPKPLPLSRHDEVQGSDLWKACYMAEEKYYKYMLK